MLTTLVLGAIALISPSITAQMLDQNNYEMSLKELNGLFPQGLDYQYEEDLFQSEGDITSEEEKFEIERGVPTLRAHKIRCVEKKSAIESISSNEHLFYPSRYYNISCVPDSAHETHTTSYYRGNNWRIECEPPTNQRNKCVQAYKTVQVFKKNAQDCWEPTRQLKVEAGCKCKHNERI